MAYIIRNNIRYIGGSGSGGNNVSLDASNVVFDDTNTQFGADNVQNVIEKLNTNLDEQNKNLKWKLYKEATGEVNNTNAVSVNIADIDDIVNEYRVVVTINVSTVTKGKFCFDIMPKEYGTYLQGYYNDEAYSGCVSLAYNITDFYVTNTNTWTKINAPNVNLANTTIKVYYR